jgi:hypothetical protein
VLAIRSVSLPADAGKTGPVDIFGNGGEHFRVHSQVSHRFKFSLLHRHRFSGESLAHTLGLHSALLGVDAPSSVVAALPADGDGGIVAGLLDSYKVKVSMHAA